MTITSNARRAMQWVANAQRLGLAPVVTEEGETRWRLECNDSDLGAALWLLLMDRRSRLIALCDLQEEVDRLEREAAGLVTVRLRRGRLAVI